MTSVILSDHRVPVSGLLEVVVEGIGDAGSLVPEDAAVQIVQPDGSLIQADLFLARSFEAGTDESGTELRPAGRLHYRARFSPRLPGGHELAVVQAGNPGDKLAFDATDEPSGAFVRARGNGLVRDDGQPLFPIGVNLLLPQRAHVDHGTFLGSAAGANINVVRVVLPACRDGNAPPLSPWQPGRGPLDLRLEELWRLDRVFETAAAHGIWIILGLLDHGAFAEPEPDGHGWCWNPFNAANGGPCESAGDFFANGAAFTVFGTWLRYMVARYSAFSSLMAWELVNEFDRIGLGGDEADQEAVMAEWHRKTASLLRLGDPYGHLISSSAWWFRGGHRTLQLPQLTLAQTHYAVDTEPSGDLSDECYYIAERRRRDYRKPYLIGAFGSHGGHTPEDRRAAEVGIHNGLWASAFACAAGPAMPAVELTESILGTFKVAGQFFRKGALDMTGFFSERWLESDGRLVVYAMGSEKESYLWVRNAGYTWQNTLRDRLRQPSRPARLTLGWHPPGQYAVEVWDTWHGLKRSDRVNVTREGLRVPLPSIATDLALRIQRV